MQGILPSKELREVRKDKVQCSVLRVQPPMILDSSMVEHSAVNRRVVGSSPTRGVKCQRDDTQKKPADIGVCGLFTFCGNVSRAIRQVVWLQEQAWSGNPRGKVFIANIKNR